MTDLGVISGAFELPDPILRIRTILKSATSNILTGYAVRMTAWNMLSIFDSSNPNSEHIAGIFSGSRRSRMSVSGRTTLSERQPRSFACKEYHSIGYRDLHCPVHAL